MMVNMVSTSEAESGALGSSMISRRALREMALAISTSCFWAGLNFITFADGSSLTFISSKIWAARRFKS